MGTQVLAGSIGYYKSANVEFEKSDSARFVVTQDTCLEADRIPVKFSGAVAGVYINAKSAVFTKEDGALLSDY